jgi:TonB family protein
LNVADDVRNGWATLKITVNEKGAPVWLVPVASSAPAFEAQATRCVLREHFEPALNEQGTPVSEEVTITIKFVR